MKTRTNRQPTHTNRIKCAAMWRRHQWSYRDVCHRCGAVREGPYTNLSSELKQGAENLEHKATSLFNRIRSFARRVSEVVVGA